MILKSSEYTFVASTGVVTITGAVYDEEIVKSIFNKTRGVFIYNPGVTGKNATFTYTTDTVIDCAFDTSTHANGDNLEIVICIGSPLAASILCGSRITAGTIISVPANKFWRGTVSVSASLAPAAGSAATNANARIDWTIAGTGTPAVTLGEVVLSTPAVSGLSGLSNAVSVSSVVSIFVWGGSAGGTITLNQANCTQFFGNAIGVISN
jgi:hypothetical protein